MAFYDWTCERIAKLLSMRGNGFTAQQIADALGTTRNSVMGKRNRLGVCRPNTYSENGSLGGKAVRKKKLQRFEQTPPELKRPGTIPPEPSFPLRMPSARAVGHSAIEGLRSHDCRWPIGDPRMPEFRFCGAHRDRGTMYCAHHYEASIRRVGAYDDKE